MIPVDDANFRAEVLGAREAVLVKVSTPWCGPCRALAPVVEAIAREFEGRVKVVALDAERSPGIAEVYQVRAFPTVILVKDGQEVGRQVGAVPRARLVALFEDHLEPTAD